MQQRVGCGGAVARVGVSKHGVDIGAGVDAFAGAKIRGQLKRETPDKRNPLGRVMSIYTDNPDIDIETLELKLDEAILRETAPLETGLSFIKVLYVVAPLLGLLGTVVGMIATFQMITLFGTGDPRMMAGGISTALVTTVLGLVVAIPLTLFHSFLQGKSKALIQVLEIARRGECVAGWACSPIWRSYGICSSAS